MSRGEESQGMNNTESFGLTDDEFYGLQEDIQQPINEANRKYGCDIRIELLSVSPALRTNLESFQVLGQIATVTTVYNMLSAINLQCSSCGNKWKENNKKKPKSRIPDIKSFSCNKCTNEEATILLTPEWIPALDIQLQDTE